METIMYTLLGVFLGGIISWALAYEYWRKERTKKPETASADETIELSPQDIWNIITSPYFESHLDWRGEYKAPPRLHEEHEVNNGLYKSKIYFQVISEPYELAWGGDPIAWDHRITLQPLEKGTRLCLERVFSPYIANWFEFVLDGFNTAKGVSSSYALVKSDVEKFKACIRQYVAQRQQG